MRGCIFFGTETQPVFKNMQICGLEHSEGDAGLIQVTCRNCQSLGEPGSQAQFLGIGPICM